ncbi:MAG: caspase family protein [Spirochaetaceae bacterium]
MKNRYLILILLIFGSYYIFSLDSIEPKTALIIANSNYTNFTKLANPVNEAKELKSTLESLGFEVFIAVDTTKETLQETVLDFKYRLLEKGGTALFHYGGHAVQIDGQNYIIPVNAKFQDESRAKIYGVNLNDILSTIDSSNSETNIVILDACRDNPLKSSTRSATRGLSVINIAPKNSIVVYSAQAGMAAVDGLFTPSLIKHIKSKKNLLEIIQDVRSEVYEKSNGAQLPGTYEQLFEPIYLHGKPKIKVVEKGRVHITSKESGEVFIDEKFHSKIKKNSYLFIEDLSYGNHQVTLTYPSYSDVQEINVTEKRVSVIDSIWEENPTGTIDLFCDVDVDIYEKDNFIGSIKSNSNNIISNLSEGKHQFEFRKGDKTLGFRNIFIERNQVTKSSITFPKEKEFKLIVNFPYGEVRVSSNNRLIKSSGYNTYIIPRGKNKILLENPLVESAFFNVSDNNKDTVIYDWEDYILKNGRLNIIGLPKESKVDLISKNDITYSYITDNNNTWNSPDEIMVGEYTVSLTGPFIEKNVFKINIAENVDSIFYYNDEIYSSLQIEKVKDSPSLKVEITDLYNPSAPVLNIILDDKSANEIRLNDSKYRILISNADDIAPSNSYYRTLEPGESVFLNVGEIEDSIPKKIEKTKYDILLSNKLKNDPKLKVSRNMSIVSASMLLGGLSTMALTLPNVDFSFNEDTTPSDYDTAFFTGLQIVSVSGILILVSVIIGATSDFDGDAKQLSTEYGKILYQFEQINLNLPDYMKSWSK